ncbi:MAG TPA: heavy metal translocating P-type ATPase, partial [Actinomycetota bacterium]|nr:heavy metal translocating P-type ATPase [Actinomycetota bacterium]
MQRLDDRFERQPLHHDPHGSHASHDDGEGGGSHGSHGSHAGAADHGGHHAAAFRRRFWVSLALSLPVIVTSPMIMDWFGYRLAFPGLGLVGPVLGTVIFLWGGWPFLEGGWHELRSRRPGMMLLISMAISVAFTASMATSLGLLHVDFWWELAALVTIMLLGHWLEMRALGQARDALSALAELLPDEADLVEDDGSVRTVPASALRPGHVVLVRAGGRVPADGEIAEGEAELDESMITGESRPVARGPGQRVVAGTVSTDSSLKLRVSAIGEDTALAGIRRLVEQAQSSRSRAQVLADRAAAVLFYVATGAGVATFVVWSALGSPYEAVMRLVTVLVISCPHALGLATPLVTSLSSAIAARAGILVRDRLSLERSRTVDTFLFDKTGTLTRGEHAVVGLAASDPWTEEELLALAAAAEAQSEHPLGRAIVRAARERGLHVPAVTSFRSLPGRGVEAEVDGRRLGVGGPRLLAERGTEEPEELNRWADTYRARGASILYLVDGTTVAGAVALEDEVRPEAGEAVRSLQRLGRRVVLITGDAAQVAEAVARDLGIDEVLAEVLPQDKAAKVAELQHRGRSVAMIGDGVNDAPALARADVGIAIGAGTDVAIESAGLVLAGSDPRSVPAVVSLSRASHRKSVQN